MDFSQQEKQTKSIVISILIIMLIIAVVIPLMTSPMNKLLGDSGYAIRSAFHGLFAMIFMITSTIGLYQALRLWQGASLNITELKIGSVINAAACFLTIFFGNWIYIPYRAAVGPKNYFMTAAPEIHRIFFEFKEFVALFTLPLTVVAAYIVCLYGEKFISNQVLRTIVALMLVLSFFYFIGAFGLGAAITKLKSV